MEKTKVLLYGANGYTGRLIARYAADESLQLILAGRKETELKKMAEEFHFPYQIFSLDHADILRKQLAEIKVVIHAAGPFIDTAQQMVEACIATGTHYIDINGDISVFEMIQKYNAEAKAAGVMLLPGAGFDVVPTDCVALTLKNKLPDAIHLQLAFVTLGGQISHGTATTMAGKIGEGGAARKNGKIIQVPLGHKGMWLQLNEKSFFVMNIPWGDVSTAYFTTGIPNIETFTGIQPSVYRILKFQSLFNWLLRTNWMRKYIQKKINARPAGPSDEQRAKAKTYVWGRAANAEGTIAEMQLVCADGYTLTALSCLLISKQILENNYQSGYQTPALVYGEKFIFSIRGSRLLD